MMDDVIIIGAGASGLMCAIEAGKRGRKVRVLDHAHRAGTKILMSGGGRCNFTNYDVSAENYIANNPHFCKSALSRFTQWDFLDWVTRYRIPYHERDHGQLFCNETAKDILMMLLTECENVGVSINLDCQVLAVEKNSEHGFSLQTTQAQFVCTSLVVATGGLSIPKVGASPFGYKLAEQFGIKVFPTRAGLVPLTLQPEDKLRFTPLTGIAVPCEITFQHTRFKENILFTHRGLSGPAILQISNYWQPGLALSIDLLPELDLYQQLIELRQAGHKTKLFNVLSEFLPKRLLQILLFDVDCHLSLQNCNDLQLKSAAASIKEWKISPNGTEGYRTAEVTLGGVDCDEISSKTFESHRISGLYFIGEVLDVTGWLGGYNFQWAWSSGWCAGQYV
jgi:predicted Rossmann fold flavoprotein